jgi:photosystem II stability/assembly factor-like uncharacterized protein
MGDYLEDRLRQHWDRPVQARADAGERLRRLADRRRRRRITVVAAGVLVLAAAGGVAAAVVPGGSGTEQVTVASSRPCVHGAGGGFPSTSPVAIDAAGVGWVSDGYDGATLRHTDGGVTLRSVGPSAYAESFVDSCSARLLVGGDNGGGRTDFVVRATDDGGRTWDSTDLGVHADSDDALAFADNQHGIAVFGDLSNGSWSSEIYRTSDGGRTWQHVADEPFTGPAAMVTPDLAFVTDRGGTGVYRSADGGQTWTRTTIPPPNSLAPVVFTSPTRGISSGSGSSPLQATNDAGRTWHPLAPIPTGGMNGIDFGDEPVAAISSNDLIVVFNGLLARSTDGGRTWQGPTTIEAKVGASIPRLTAISTLDFTSPTQGWALTQVFTLGGAKTSRSPATPDQLIHTTDGGQHWTTITTLGTGKSPPTAPVTPPPTTTSAGCPAQQLKIINSRTGIFGGGMAGYILTVQNTRQDPCSLSNKVDITGERVNINTDGIQGPSGPRQPLTATIANQQPPLLKVPPGQDATFAIEDYNGCPGAGGEPYDHLQIAIPGTGTIDPDQTHAVLVGCVIVQSWQIGTAPDLEDLPNPANPCETPGGSAPCVAPLDTRSPAHNQ